LKDKRINTIAPFPPDDRTSKLNPRSPLPFLDWAIAFWGRNAILGGEERSRFFWEGRSAFGRGAIGGGKGRSLFFGRCDRFLVGKCDRVFWEMSDRFWEMGDRVLVGRRAISFWEWSDRFWWERAIGL